MTTELSKIHARSFLSAHDFSVDEIPEVLGEKRADLLATCSGEEYVVEAKMKYESESWLDLWNSARIDGAASVSRSVVPWSGISSMISRAHDQLLATPSSDDAFRVLWVTALHDDDDFVIDCVEKRLFGLERLSVVTSLSLDAEVTTKSCYFHGMAAFRRFRTLDATVLATRRGIRLCANTFSPSLPRLRRARLYRLLAAQGAVRNPEVAEQSEEAFLLGEDYSPDATGRAAWEYIRKKYGVLTSKMFERNFRSLISIPRQMLE